MSYQHLYSRVPARVSLFNKRDGFDTFAHSAGLEPSFILGELSCVYSDKLGIQDPRKVRAGEIPTVFSQAALSEGRVAHTAISYCPVDYTGERSAYFAHTLVLSGEEKSAVLNSASADCFNPDTFFTDITRFNITAPGAAPNPACAEMAYPVKALSDHRATVKKYDAAMIKSFIYSVLCAACGGEREVLFRLPCDDRQASAEALALINAVLSILPYGLRERLSYVTLVNDAQAYSGFMLKCIGSGVEYNGESRAVLYDFAANKVIGRAESYDRYTLLASFLYSLFDYKKIREAFLPFVAGITDRYQLTLDVDTLREIVFMFWQCSGFYVENSFLADDEAVCILMDVYGKYREGLSEEHRVRAYRPLARYADNHTAIPDGVLSRLSSLYPGECAEARAVALDVLLKLIHLDLMRDTIFCFISRYYDSELDSVKAVISANLSRVFYGGFLQHQILAFFDVHFRAESAETREDILNKLILSVRTPEIQRQVLTFLDRHYGVLTKEQKLNVCKTALEMIPEGDTLSALFVSLINRRIGKEGGEIAEYMSKSLTDILAYTLTHGDGRLLAIFVENPGFCEALAFRFVLTYGIGAELLVALLAAMPAHKRGDKLVRAYRVLGEKNKRLYIDFLLRFTGLPVVVAPSGLKDLLRLDKIASLTLPADALVAVRERIIYPVIPYVFADVFKKEYGEGGLSELEKYAENNPVIVGLPQYSLILNYRQLISKCNLGDTEAAFRVIEALPEDREILSNVGEYINNYAYAPDSEGEESDCTYQLVVNYLTTGKLGLGDLYTEYQKHYEEIYEDDGVVVKGLNADRRGAVSAIELIISCADGICDVSHAMTARVVAEDSGLRRALADFIAVYGFGAGLFLKKRIKDCSTELEDIVDELMDERNASITSFGDAVDILLRRKN